ncbi:PKD domain-containing protein [Paludisphaera sp.]|uniref:PKD domain-containing protein n=1 Tax=Paludisphaera sp. TaxID=2017432 RepID=UPI00301D06BB
MSSQLTDRRSPKRSGLSGPRPRGGRRARATRGLSVEGLEARALLSTMFVDDDWAGTVAGTDLGGGKVFGANAFATIQSAIGKAVAEDEIHVAEGTYTGAVTISKQLTIIGAGSSTTTLNVAGLVASNAVTISTSGVSLSGLTVTGAGNDVRPQYGVGVSGRSGLALSDVTVVGMVKSGVNLNGVTDFTITGVAARDNGGAGFFLTDAKRGTLTDVTTSGNVWTGLAFSTAGRHYAIGVEEIVIAGASTFGEAGSANGGVMFEESSWNFGTNSYDPANPFPITFSTDAADGADVTFKQDQPLGYALSGPQDDAWSVRRRFYATAEQGLAAAAGSPDHYLAHGRALATVGAFGEARTFLVAPIEAMGIQAAIDAAAAGDTIQIAAGTYAGAITIGKSLTIAGDGSSTTILDVAGSAASYAARITAADVSLSGLTITGAGSDVKPQYGVFSAGRSGLSLTDVTVVGMVKSGVNLNGSTNFSLTGVVSLDNGGAGIFLQDVKHGTLTDVATSGNVWTGLGFSTSGRYYAIGVEGVVIAGASTFGEAGSANGGVMFEESSWDNVLKVHDPSNPHPITFSTSEADGANVTFKQEQPLGYVLSGPQDDEWSARRLFFATAEQGLAAAAGSPTHYLAHGRALATVGAFGEARTFLVAPVEAMSVQAALDAAAGGDTVRIAPGVYAENVSAWRPVFLEGQEGATLRPASGVALSIFGSGLTTLVSGLRIDGGDVGIAIRDGAGGVILDGVAVVGLDVGVRVGAADGVTIASSIIEGNGDGVEVLDAGATNVGLRWNRIVGNSRSSVRNLAASAVDAVHNWWGSNAGPGASAVGNVDSSPHIVLTLSNPGPLLVGGSAGLVADLKHDSTGADISALGSIPGFSAAAFAASLGSVGPASAPVIDGEASSTFSAGATPGQALVTAKVDDALASIMVEVAAPPLAIDGPASVNQGLPYTLSLTAGAEAGVVSRWRIDWGDGTPLQVVEGSPSAVTHAFLAPGARAIRAWAQTEHGEYEAGNSVAVVVANVAPTVAIVAGPTTVVQGSAASFRAEGSDPGGVAEYTWSATLGGVVVATGVGETFSFAPTSPGVYAISVTVADAQGATAVAERSLTVANAAPTVAIVAGPATVVQGSAASFRAEGADPGGVAEYTWSAALGGVVVATGVGETFSFAPTTPGEYTVGVTVIDAQGATAYSERGLTVENLAPSLELAAIPALVDVGAAVTFGASSVDANPGATLAFNWLVLRNGETVATGEGPTMTFTPQLLGAYEVIVQVSDGEGGVVARSVSFMAAPLPVGPLPPAAEQAVQGVVARAIVQVERQEQRLAELAARFESRPAPMIQRMIQRTIQVRERIQAMTVRRVAMIQRTFGILRGPRR